MTAIGSRLQRPHCHLQRLLSWIFGTFRGVPCPAGMVDRPVSGAVSPVLDVGIPRRAGDCSRPVGAIGRLGRYAVGVPAVGVPGGKPGDPTPIRTLVTGGWPRGAASTLPAASRIVGPESGESSTKVWSSSLTVGWPSTVTEPV